MRNLCKLKKQPQRWRKPQQHISEAMEQGKQNEAKTTTEEMKLEVEKVANAVSTKLIQEAKKAKA